MLACQDLVNMILISKTRSPYISGQQRVDCERPSLSLIICSEDNEDIFDADHECEGPDDERKGAEQVIVARVGREGARVDV